MRPHSKPQAGAGPWVLWDWTRTMGINSWERRREKGTTPPGSSQHMVGLSISFDDCMIVLLWRGPSIFHLHLALADHFSLGAEREVLKVAFIFLGPGHSSSGSRSHLVGRLSIGPCNAAMPQSSQRPFFQAGFSCCVHRCLLVSPRQRQFVLHSLPKMECSISPLQS